MDVELFPKMAPFEEKQLSQQFNSNVTLEVHHTFILTSAQMAEEDIQAFLPSLHSRQLKILGCRMVHLLQEPNPAPGTEHSISGTRGGGHCS